MTGRALSEETMLASLRDIDIPAQAAGGLPADIAMTVGLAGAAALLVAGVLRLLSQKHRSKPATTLQDRLNAARVLPEGDRRVALLHLLRDQSPERYRQVARDLYRPEATLPADLVLQGRIVAKEAGVLAGLPRPDSCV